MAHTPHSPRPALVLALLASAATLAACSQEKSADSAAADTDAAEPAAPAIAGAVAPGVAFQYRYAFTLAAKSIADVQQRHAAACQKLGVQRCRITGMGYDRPREGEVSAHTDFMLAPDLAHAFGSEGVAAVEAAAGKLESAGIDGRNAGDAIKLSQADSAANQAEAARIEARLAAPGLGKSERRDLESRLTALHGRLGEEAKARRTDEAAIASTPVIFSYASDGLIGGSGSPFGKAASASWSSAQTALGVVLVLAGFALPWLALGALVLFVVRAPGLRRVLRRAFGRHPRPSGTE